jgi:hypothetical protein
LPVAVNPAAIGKYATRIGLRRSIDGVDTGYRDFSFVDPTPLGHNQQAVRSGLSG